MTPDSFLTFAVNASFLMVVLALFLAFIRLIKGPSLSDRVIALDMMTITIMAFCGVFAIFSEDQAFLDVAVVLALIGFLTTLSLARFAERRAQQHSRSEGES